jgi:hypothetical protein
MVYQANHHLRAELHVLSQLLYRLWTVHIDVIPDITAELFVFFDGHKYGLTLNESRLPSITFFRDIQKHYRYVDDPPAGTMTQQPRDYSGNPQSVNMLLNKDGLAFPE